MQGLDGGEQHGSGGEEEEQANNCSAGQCEFAPTTPLFGKSNAPYTILNRIRQKFKKNS
jgi:hypothetical protein